MPVAINARRSSDPLNFSASTSTTTPISKQPTTLTQRVDQGKPLPSHRPKPTLMTWRAPEPRAPPSMAQSRGFMAGGRSRRRLGRLRQAAADHPAQPPSDQQGYEIGGHEYAVLQVTHLVWAGEGELVHHHAGQSRTDKNRGERRDHDGACHGNQIAHASSPGAARSRSLSLPYLPEPDFLCLCVVGVVAEPGEPFHQPLGRGAIAVPNIDMVTRRCRLTVALPVILDVDDARAAENLGVKVRGLGADDALDFSHPGDRGAGKPARQLRGADVVHLLGGMHVAGGLAQ